MSKIQTKKVVFFMIPIPKFILKKCLRPIWYFKFKDRNLSKTTWRYVKNTNNKSSFFMIPIPKFILKKCLRPIWYFKFKSISLANT